MSDAAVPAFLRPGSASRTAVRHGSRPGSGVPPDARPVEIDRGRRRRRASGESDSGGRACVVSGPSPRRPVSCFRSPVRCRTGHRARCVPESAARRGRRAPVRRAASPEPAVRRRRRRASAGGRDRAGHPPTPRHARRRSYRPRCLQRPGRTGVGDGGPEPAAWEPVAAGTAGRAGAVLRRVGAPRVPPLDHLTDRSSPGLTRTRTAPGGRLPARFPPCSFSPPCSARPFLSPRPRPAQGLAAFLPVFRSLCSTSATFTAYRPCPERSCATCRGPIGPHPVRQGHRVAEGRLVRMPRSSRSLLVTGSIWHRALQLIGPAKPYRWQSKSRIRAHRTARPGRHDTPLSHINSHKTIVRSIHNEAGRNHEDMMQRWSHSVMLRSPFGEEHRPAAAGVLILLRAPRSQGEPGVKRRQRACGVVRRARTDPGRSVAMARPGIPASGPALGPDPLRDRRRAAGAVRRRHAALPPPSAPVAVTAPTR